MLYSADELLKRLKGDFDRFEKIECAGENIKVSLDSLRVGAYVAVQSDMASLMETLKAQSFEGRKEVLLKIGAFVAGTSYVSHHANIALRLLKGAVDFALL